MTIEKENPLNTPDTIGPTDPPSEQPPKYAPGAGGHVGGTIDPRKPGSGLPDTDQGGGERDDEKDPNKTPSEPTKTPPGPAPAWDPIPEPIEGDQDLGKRSETTPGRS